MKSSTLHRSGLTRERMAMLENTRVTGFDSRFDNKFDKTDLPTYRTEQPQTHQSSVHAGSHGKASHKHSDLDVLYKNVEKTFHKATSATLGSKTPGAYLAIGFVAGLLTMLVISIIVALASGGPKEAPKSSAKGAPVTVVASEKFQETAKTTEEKYVVKSGDTLDKIAFRFYGKYDNAKINKIQEMNNISNPNALQIGQVIVVPLN